MVVIKKIKEIKPKIKIVEQLGGGENAEGRRMKNPDGENSSEEGFEERAGEVRTPLMEAREGRNGAAGRVGEDASVQQAVGTTETQERRAQNQENTNRLYDVGRTLGGNAPERIKYLTGEEMLGRGKGNWIAPEQALLDRERFAARQQADPRLSEPRGNLEQENVKRYDTVEGQDSGMTAKRRKQLF